MQAGVRGSRTLESHIHSCKGPAFLNVAFGEKKCQWFQIPDPAEAVVFPALPEPKATTPSIGESGAAVLHSTLHSVVSIDVKV